MFDLLQFIVERWPYDVSATGLIIIENPNFQITEQAYLDFRNSWETPVTLQTAVGDCACLSLPNQPISVHGKHYSPECVACNHSICRENMHGY